MKRAAEDRVLVVATTNRGKLREIQALLVGLPVRVVAASDLGPVAYPDEGDDYEANAVAKARTVAAAFGRLALGDDSGLEVAALGGRPGVRSARYGGPRLDDVGRVARLLGELAETLEPDRAARFVCWAALADPSGRVATALGTCAGHIASKPRGDRGFGYDPVFVPNESTRTLAEFTAAEKDRISHRGAAIRGLVPQLREWIEEAASRTGR